MSIQTSVTSTPAAAKEGMLADSGYHDILSGLFATRKLVQVVPTASNSKVYTITINGTDFVYTADGSATVAEITAGLVAEINDGDEPVLATDGTTLLLIESTIDGPGGDFTYADSVDSVGTLVETVLVAQSASLRVGKGVCLDERRQTTVNGVADLAIRSPRLSTDITAQGAFLGIVVEQFDAEQLPVSAAAFADAITVAGNQALNVLHEGRCWVRVEEAVTPLSTPHCRYASGAGGTVLGAIRASTDTSSAAAIPRARFLSTAAAAGLAILEVTK